MDKYVKVQNVIDELKFQRERMIKYFKENCDDYETNWIVSVALLYFDIAIHGVEEHIEHYEF